MFEYDICWCADSDRCTHTECFRHLENKPIEERIFTMSHLMGEENLCPEFDKEGKNVSTFI